MFSAKKEFLGSALYNRQSLIMARVYTNESKPFDEEFIRGRIQSAAALREQCCPVARRAASCSANRTACRD